MDEFVGLMFRFALICLTLSCFVAYRSRANYEWWLTHRRTVYLTTAQTMHSLSQTAFIVGRWALFFAVVSFLLFINQ
jgi:hypothetical protein